LGTRNANGVEHSARQIRLAKPTAKPDKIAVIRRHALPSARCFNLQNPQVRHKLPMGHGEHETCDKLNHQKVWLKAGRAKGKTLTRR
jgi:hypothetical protein